MTPFHHRHMMGPELRAGVTLLPSQQADGVLWEIHVTLNSPKMAFQDEMAAKIFQIRSNFIHLVLGPIICPTVDYL